MRHFVLLAATCLAFGLTNASSKIEAQETTNRARAGDSQEEGGRRGLGRRRQQDGASEQDQQVDGARRVGFLMQLFDADRSGDLSVAEIDAMAQTMKAMDRDDDGTVTPAEIMRSIGNRGPMNRQRRDGAGAEANNRGGDVDPKQVIERILARADRDGDNLISKDEAPARLKENFDQLDVNGDGKLSAEEMTTPLMRLRDRGRMRDGDNSLQGVEPKRPGKGDGNTTD